MSRCEAPESPLSPRCRVLIFSAVFSASSSASPRLRVKTQPPSRDSRSLRRIVQPHTIGSNLSWVHNQLSSLIALVAVQPGGNGPLRAGSRNLFNARDAGYSGIRIGVPAHLHGQTAANDKDRKSVV